MQERLGGILAALRQGRYQDSVFEVHPSLDLEPNSDFLQSQVKEFNSLAIFAYLVGLCTRDEADFLLNYYTFQIQCLDASTPYNSKEGLVMSPGWGARYCSKTVNLLAEGEDSLSKNGSLYLAYLNEKLNVIAL